MSNNNNLNKARKEKNDEFYTKWTDIEREVFHYREQMRGKTIFCNCDDPAHSNFWKYFEINFHFFGLRKLISTHYEASKPSYKSEYDGKTITNTLLEGNGDFRSAEAVELLKECDIVVTNPPFSLFRAYIAQLIEHDKKFLVVGNVNAVKYKEVFKLIKDNKIWLGHYKLKEFIQPDGTTKKFGNINWFTNLDTTKRYESLLMYKSYDPTYYPMDNTYNAINVDKVVEIPCDYEGVMGVPITFMDKYNPAQFELVGKANSFYVGGKETYERILIRRRM
jgi:hypothetical protein